MNIILNKPETQRRGHKMGEEPGKLFIGAVHSQVTKEEFRSFFEKFGEVSDIVLMHDSATNKNRGFGFVTFKDPAISAKVMQTGPHLLNGREIDAKPSVQRGQLPPSKPLQNKSLDKKVFVGGVAQGTSEDGLRKFFDSQNLPVQDIVLMHDNQTLKSRGFGFVTFADDNTVERVCRTRFFNIDNKTVECKKAEPRGKNDMQGGGPGGPGGNFNPMQRGGPGGAPNMGGPNMGGFNQGWNQNPNPGYGNNQYNQGGGNFGQQGGWGGPQQQAPMGNYGQQPPQQQQQQQGYGPRAGSMPNQGYRGQYNNANGGGYNQHQQAPQQGGYGQTQQQPQQQQPQQQQPQQQQQQANYGTPQNYGNYGNYGQQQQQQQQQQQPPQQQQQPDQYNQQAPQQTNQGYNTGNYGAQGRGNYAQNGNMGNYPQEASGYGPQRVNYNTPAQGNFNQQQGGGYTADTNVNYGAPGVPQQQPQPHPQQNYGQQADHSQDMYGAAPQAPGNIARGGNNTAVPFHPYRR